MRTIVAVAGIIMFDNKILLAQRMFDDKTYPGKWEFPGGKIEPGETPEDALKREINEELSLNIHDLKIFAAKTKIERYSGRDYHLVIIYYLCEAEHPDFVEMEVNAAVWVNKEEIPLYDLADLDYEIALQLNNLHL